MIKSFNTPAMKFRRAQAGITLIEVSIGLIIAAIIAAAAFIAFQSNARRQEIKENASNITEIASEVRTKFIRTNRVDQIDDAGALESANILSPIGGQPVNSYGGAVTFAVANGVVTMSWDGVEDDQCVDLASTVLSGGFTQISVGGAPLTVDSTIGDIQTACTTGTDFDIVI